MDKVINYTYYDPNHALFKSKSSDREHITVYSCNNSENCEAYKNNHCIMLNDLTNHGCPYGNKRRQFGYTKTAKKCGDLISATKSTYPNLGWALKDIDRPCAIGDYVYLPVAFLSGYNNPFDAAEVFYKDMFKKTDFTPELVVKLIGYRPKALMGGVITDYEKKYIPKLCFQLKKYMPKLYAETFAIFPEIETLASQYSFVGKYAKVKTLLPGEVEIGSYSFKWDGTVLTASHGAGKVLGTWNKLTDEVLTITPKNDTVVRIVDDNTVGDDTEFSE